MGKDKTSIAKISRPKISGVFPRKRLFAELDAGRKKQITWITGPAGSGKTTLAASYLDARKLPCLWYQVDAGDADIATFFYYLGLAAKQAAPRHRKPLPLLTPEYMPGIATFTQRFFESLCARLKHPSAIVFDNYEAIPPDSPFHALLQNAVAHVPNHIRIFVLSRSEPPAGFMRLRANDAIQIVGWSTLRFTMEESQRLLRSKTSMNISDATIRHLQEHSEGWASGLVLMLEVLKAGGHTSPAAALQAPQEVFDYLAGEVLEKSDDESRSFLFMTAFLPKMTVPMAEHMTGQLNAGKLLSDLNRNHFFIEQLPAPEPIYRFHALFRNFLIARAKDTFQRDDIVLFQKRAAALLEEADQKEDAVPLLHDAHDWENLIRVILDTARTLLEHGRNKTLERWLMSLPEELRQNDPRILYWLGMSRMTADLNESRACLSRAFALYTSQKHHAGACLAWAGVIDTFVYEWSDFTQLDYWIDQIEKVLSGNPEFPSLEIEARVTAGLFCALKYRQPQHPKLPLWEARLRELVLTDGDIQLRVAISSHLILYYAWWCGDLAKASLVMSSLRAAIRSPAISPLTRLIWHASAAAFSWITADNEECLSLVDSGLKLAESSGVHVCDFMLLAQGSFGTLTSGNLAAATRSLQRMAFILQTNRTSDIAHYHAHLAWSYLCASEYNLALEHMKTAFGMMQASRIPWGQGFTLLGMAEILIELKQYDKARTHLDEAWEIIERTNIKNLEYQHAWIEALYFFRTGDQEAGLGALRRYLVISRETGISCHFCWRSRIMAELYAQALTAGIEVEQVQHLIRKHHVAPNEADRFLEQWPWQLAIHTLGRFEVVQNGKPLAFNKKVPKKPLEMLKALIAFGGQQVSQARLTNALWPDTDGDAAHKSFSVTLIRLREVLGLKDAIRLQDGKVSLDARLVWLDTWAFEHCADAVSAKQRAGSGSGDQNIPDQLLACYKGPFLVDEEGHWAIAAREKFRDKLRYHLEQTGRNLENKNQFLKAIECYRQGLDADECVEEFYQRSMICYRKIGRGAEAVAAYKRCKNALNAHGLKPSPETEALYQELAR